MSDGAGKYRRLLDEAIENLSQYFFDSFEHGNAEFRSSAGLPMIVIREELGDCCSWCADLAGTYDYADAPPEVWQRHAHCRCMVITRTERGTYQDAWSRKEYQSQREAGIAREQEIKEDISSERAKRLTGPEKDLYQYGENAINVDMDYINSQEYRMKYHGISESAKVDDIIYEQAKAVLGNRSGTYYEELILIDSKTGEIVVTHRDSHVENAVKYTEKTERTIKEALKENRELIAIHNHPEGYPPTADDAVSALTHGYVKGVVCGHNGKVYTYFPAKRKMSVEECERIHSIIQRQYVQGTDIDNLWKNVLNEYRIIMEVR